MRREKRRKWGKGEERKWGRGEWGAGEERERSGEVLWRDVYKTSDMSRKASSSSSSPPSMFALNTPSASRQGVVLSDLQSLLECQ